MKPHVSNKLLNGPYLLAAIMPWRGLGGNMNKKGRDNKKGFVAIHIKLLIGYETDNEKFIFSLKSTRPSSGYPS